jgi:hypothetical protein
MVSIGTPAPADAPASRPVSRLAMIAAGATVGFLVLGALYLWAVRGEVLFLEGALSILCL